jgi:hypothetical protein
MAGEKGHSGPLGNANVFRHGLSAIQRRRADGDLTDKNAYFARLKAESTLSY